jgi:apolipoprotein N-acyltransferase
VVKTSRRYGPRPGTLASTACIALAFPPVEWPALIWIGLIPWLFALERCKRASEAIAQGFWLNFLLGFTSAFWVAYAVPRYLGVSLLVGVLALVLHALVHQLQLAVFAGAHWGSKRAAVPQSLLGLTSVALLYTGIDWATPKLFQDTLGFALHGYPALRQLAAIGGAPLLTFIVLLVNLGLFTLAREYSARRRGSAETARLPLSRVLWIALPLAGFWALGAYEYAQISRSLRSPGRTLRVGLVQGNVADELKNRWARGDADAAKESLDVYLRATRRLFEPRSKPELVIWPETSFPGIFRKPENDAQLGLNVAFDRYIAAQGTPLVFGAYDREDRLDRRVLRNAVYLVQPGPQVDPAPDRRVLPVAGPGHRAALASPVGPLLARRRRPRLRNFAGRGRDDPAGALDLLRGPLLCPHGRAGEIGCGAAGEHLERLLVRELRRRAPAPDYRDTP